MIKAVIFDYGGVINRNLRVQTEVMELAKELRSKGIKTAILSNMITPIVWALRTRGDFSEFDPVITSGEIGFAKPDPRIYEIMIKKLGIEPNSLVFIDNRSENLDPAKALGMHVILAKSTQQIVDDIKKLTKL